MEYTVREATEQDIPAILELFELSLGVAGGAPIESFWRWKHIDNPFGVSPVLLAFDQEQLIGLRAFMRWQWSWQGRIIPAFRAVDTATHPDYRGKGIFSKLTRQLLQDLATKEPASFIFNTPNEQSKPGYLKMGWQVLGKPHVLASLAVAYHPKALQRFQQYHRALQQHNFKGTCYLPAVDDRHIHTNYNVGYHQWRFQQIPEIPYGFWHHEKGEHGVQLFFHLKRRARFYELRICDVLWLHGKANNTLFMTACRQLARNIGTPVITFIQKEKPAPWQQVRFSLFPLQQLAPEVTIRELNDSGIMNQIKNLDTWSFAMGDLELF